MGSRPLISSVKSTGAFTAHTDTTEQNRCNLYLTSNRPFSKTPPRKARVPHLHDGSMVVKVGIRAANHILSPHNFRHRRAKRRGRTEQRRRDPRICRCRGSSSCRRICPTTPSQQNGKTPTNPHHKQTISLTAPAAITSSEISVYASPFGNTRLSVAIKTDRGHRAPLPTL